MKLTRRRGKKIEGGGAQPKVVSSAFSHQAGQTAGQRDRERREGEGVRGDSLTII